jgi:predicted GIY-YIG superfamily endonuclease/DNA-binding transcriptional regulator YiaG
VPVHGSRSQREGAAVGQSERHRYWPQAYTITHVASGRAYIGISTKLAERWSQHRTGTQGAIGRAIKEFGADAFSLELVASAVSRESAYDLERLLIRQALERGEGLFNLTDGGKRGFRFHPEVRARIAEGQRAGRRLKSKQGSQALPPSRLTPENCRTARALLNCDETTLARAARISVATLRLFETRKRKTHGFIQRHLEYVLARNGVEFIPDDGGGAGVRFKEPRRRALPEQ